MSKKRIVDILLVLGIILVGGMILVKMVPEDIFVPESPFETKQEFFEAIEKGAVEKVEQALASGEFKPGIKNDTGISALMYAIDENKPVIVEKLIKNGLEPNEPRKSLQYVQYNISEYRNEKGVVNKKYSYLYLSPLIRAAFLGHAKVVETLLDNGAKPDMFIKAKRTKEIAPELYQKAEKQVPGLESIIFSPLRVASKKGHSEVVRILLKAGANPYNQKYNSDLPVLEAVARGHVNVVKAFLETGIDPDDSRFAPKYPILLAAYEGHPEIISLLIEHGAEVNIQGDQDQGVKPLELAIMNNHVSTVELLLQNGAEINYWTKREGFTPLMIASGSGLTENVRLLLEHGAKINQLGKKHSGNALSLSVLMYKYSRPENKDEFKKTIKLLLEAGADPTLEDDEGKTAFDYAKDEEIKQLLQKYADNREGTQN
jgi:ankyrin repeat protein